MWQELAQLGTELVADESLRCLLVRGDGPSFSAGIDLVEGLGGIIAEFAAKPPDEHDLDEGLSVAGTFSWIPQLSCPSVAAVNGHAYSAGLQIAIACDFRIFAQGATVGLTETRYGILPDMGATVRLPRIVGEGRARELILLGEVIDAAEAFRIGLASRVVADDDLQSAARRSGLPPGRPAARRYPGRPTSNRCRLVSRPGRQLPGGGRCSDPLPGVRGLQGSGPGRGGGSGPRVAGTLAWLKGRRPLGFMPIVGSKFHLVAKPVPGWRGIVECEVLEVGELRLPRYTWCGDENGTPTIVTYRIEPRLEGTRLTFEHIGFTGVAAFSWPSSSAQRRPPFCSSASTGGSIGRL